MTDPPDSIDDHPDLAALPDPIAVAHEMAAAVLDTALDGGGRLSVQLRRLIAKMEAQKIILAGHGLGIDDFHSPPVAPWIEGYRPIRKHDPEEDDDR